MFSKQSGRLFCWAISFSCGTLTSIWSMQLRTSVKQFWPIDHVYLQHRPNFVGYRLTPLRMNTVEYQEKHLKIAGTILKPKAFLPNLSWYIKIVNKCRKRRSWTENRADFASFLVTRIIYLFSWISSGSYLYICTCSSVSLFTSRIGKTI